MSHDYQPDWDYVTQTLEEMDAFSDEEKAVVRSRVEHATKSLSGPLGFDQGIEVFFTAQGGLSAAGDRVAVFCSGTSSRPVIGLDLALLRAAALEQGLDFASELSISLGHELAHAYQESIGMDLGDEDYGAEDEAETFGRVWASTGEVRLDILTCIEQSDREEPQP